MRDKILVVDDIPIIRISVVSVRQMTVSVISPISIRYTRKTRRNG